MVKKDNEIVRWKKYQKKLMMSAMKSLKAENMVQIRICDEEVEGAEDVEIEGEIYSPHIEYPDKWVFEQDGFRYTITVTREELSKLNK
ncbi:MAG: hypothetical protein WCY37_05000 [Candidatus Dojkabacteria bacterium]